MLAKYFKSFFAILLCAIIFIACNGEEADNSQSNEGNQSKIEMYNKTFEQIANYDNYISGTVIEGQKIDNPTESYIIS